MAWFSVHEGTFSDAKWPVVARKAKVNVGCVVAIWLALLDHASQAAPRGSLDGFDPETIDALYGYKDGVCQRVVEALTEKGLIADDEIVNWQKRQPTKSDNGQAKSNAERQREYRTRNKSVTERNADVTERNENVTERNADVTQSNGSNALKEDNIRLKKEDIKIPPISPQGGGGEAQPSHSPPEPDMEFTLLRELCNEHMRPEGPRAGFKAYLALKKSRAWPGLCAIEHDIMRRLEAGAWNPGYEPGLEKYLNDRVWEAPLPRVRTNQLTAPTEYQKLKQESRDMARMVLEQEERDAGLENAPYAALDKGQCGISGAA